MTHVNGQSLVGPSVPYAAVSFHTRSSSVLFAGNWSTSDSTSNPEKRVLQSSVFFAIKIVCSPRSSNNIFIDAISNIMQYPFPFGVMNKWTDFLVRIFKITGNNDLKRNALTQIVFMAYSMNQFYSMDRLEELLCSIDRDDEILIVM